MVYIKDAVSGAPVPICINCVCSTCDKKCEECPTCPEDGTCTRDFCVMAEH